MCKNTHVLPLISLLKVGRDCGAYDEAARPFEAAIPLHLLIS